MRAMRLARKAPRPRKPVGLMSSPQPRFAITALLDELAQSPELQELPRVLLAISTDKDAQDIISRLRGRVRRVVCTERAPPS